MFAILALDYLEGPLQLTFYKSTRSFAVTPGAPLVVMFMSLPSAVGKRKDCSPSSLPHPL